MDEAGAEDVERGSRESRSLTLLTCRVPVNCPISGHGVLSDEIFSHCSSLCELGFLLLRAQSILIGDGETFIFINLEVSCYKMCEIQ